MIVASLMSLAMAASGQVGVVEENAQRIEVTGVGHERTIDCDNRDVVIAGTGHKLTFTGICASLDLTGSSNEVTINLAPEARVSIAGTNQTVRWSSTGRVRPNVVGYNNRVTRRN